MIKVKVAVRQVNYEELKEKIPPDARIVILSCDSCAKLNNGLGGEQGVKSLKDKLVADGFKVIHRELLSEACSPDELKGRLKDRNIHELFEEAEVIIPLSCSAGIERVEEAMPKLRILQVTKTLGLGTYSPETGVRLTEPFPGINIEIEDEDGISLIEAADRLDLNAGSF